MVIDRQELFIQRQRDVMLDRFLAEEYHIEHLLYPETGGIMILFLLLLLLFVLRHRQSKYKEQTLQ